MQPTGQDGGHYYRQGTAWYGPKCLYLLYMTTDEALIIGCIQGDINAQRALFEKFSGKMLVLCLRYATDEQEAQAILMDALLKVYDNIHKFRKECPLEAWIRRIMVNTAIKHYRKKNKIYPVVDVESVSESFSEEPIISHYGYEELLLLIRQLPERYRTVFNLYVIDGYSHKEISDMLSIPEGTSKSNLSRARNLLQKTIHQNELLKNERSG